MSLLQVATLYNFGQDDITPEQVIDINLLLANLAQNSSGIPALSVEPDDCNNIGTQINYAHPLEPQADKLYYYVNNEYSLIVLPDDPNVSALLWHRTINVMSHMFIVVIHSGKVTEVIHFD